MEKKKILLIIGTILICIGIALFFINKMNMYTVEKEFKLLTNYIEYNSLINTSNVDVYTSQLTTKDFAKNNYIFITEKINRCNTYLEFKRYKLKNNTITLFFDLEETGDFCTELIHGYFVPIDKNIKNISKVQITYKIKNSGTPLLSYPTDDKPILYLYPTEKKDVSLKLENANKIITSYPKYINEWNVTAYPNGDLYDKNGNYYYALYWDELNTFIPTFEEGFVVTKENAISFLEEKLKFIGLNAKERNEFIMYWLPKLEKNEKNLVYFELTEEREKHNKLIINPIPDSLLRINMHIKKIDNNENINIKEQKLSKTERIGFTAVEWGGTIHK